MQPVTVLSDEFDPVGLIVPSGSISTLGAINDAGLGDHYALASPLVVVSAVHLNIAKIRNAPELSRKKQKIADNAEIYAIKNREFVTDFNYGCEFKLDCAICSLSKEFDIKDDRSVESIVKLLKSRNFDPVLTDWRRIDNH